MNSVPGAGDQFQVVKNEKQAREISEYRLTKEKEKKLLKQKDESAGDLFADFGSDAAPSKVTQTVDTRVDAGSVPLIRQKRSVLSTPLIRVAAIALGVIGGGFVLASLMGTDEPSPATTTAKAGRRLGTLPHRSRKKPGSGTRRAPATAFSSSTEPSADV